MNEKLQNYVELLFAGAPHTAEVGEIREEILQNTIDRYNDLIAEGKTETEAYQAAIAEIGNINQLLQSIGNNNTYGYTPAELAQDRRKSSLMLTIAVILYILSVLPPILFSETRFEDNLGPALMFCMIAAATGLLIYRAKTKPHVTPGNPTVVEQFERWNRREVEDKSLYQNLTAAVWAICLVIYFVLSFITGAWHITWIMFLIAFSVSNIIRACLDLGK